jgi:hypothetical protein
MGQASQFRLLVAVVPLAALTLALAAHAGLTGSLPFRVADHDAWLDSNDPCHSSLFPSTLRGCLKYRFWYSENGIWMVKSECYLLGKGWTNQPMDADAGAYNNILCYWCPSSDELDSVFKW